MRSYEPSWRDRIGAYLFDQTSGSPVSRRAVEGLVGSTGLGNTGLSVADVVPGGQVLAAQEALREGDYKGAAMAVMPIPGASKLGPLARSAAPIKAYHSSPHDFDKFDLSKIGTGEGPKGWGDVAGIPDIKNPISVFPKPQRMFPEENRPAGGQYLNAKTKEDMTGHKAAQASIGVQPGGRPFFDASAETVEQTGSHGKGNATAKTNLFKQKAGWKWVDAPEGHGDTGTIVSVEHRGHHHYALNAHFPKGVDLARYENSTSEPRLRPTTKGNVTKGDQVGTISVRGKEHPVYNYVIVKAGGGSVVHRALTLTRGR